MREERKLNVSFLGTIPYGECLALQKEIHRLVLDSGLEATLLLLEHEPVITLGKHASERDILVGLNELRLSGISLEHVDRGGEATAHEPGQLVAYPILPLRFFNLGPRSFVFQLEEAVIQLLASFSIEAHRDTKFPGVWVGDRKICSIGIRINRGVSYHGIALNVSNSLDTFRRIIPCGIEDRGLTTVSELLGKEVTVHEVAEAFLRGFRKVFGINFLSVIEQEALITKCLGHKLKPI